MNEFEDILKCISTLCQYHLEEGQKTYSIDDITDKIKLALNKIFPDFKCRRVIYNANTDKSFFGTFIQADYFSNPQQFIQELFAGLYDNGQAVDLDTFEAFKPESYQLEIDGRIFASDVLSPNQVWAILFDEICAMNSTQPINQLRAMIDTYVAAKGMHINLDYIKKSSETFNMVTMVTLHNLTSVFAKYGEDVTEPLDITVESGLGEYYRTAINTLKENMEWQQPIADTTGLMLNWYFYHYDWIKENRNIEYMFKEIIETESSQLLRMAIQTALNQNVMILDADNKYYTDRIQEGFFNNGNKKRRGLIWQMKRNGIKSIEDDLFEYTMRVKNIETEDDAILLMRQINSRMSILEDYLRDEDDIDDIDKKRWEECYKQYVEIRDTLSKKTLYKRKQMGLWMDYNYLNNDASNGQSAIEPYY